MDPSQKYIEIRIGRGSYGEVVELRGHQPPAVIKYIECKTKAMIASFEKECDILKKLSHPNIVNLIGTKTQDGSDKFGIIMEFCKKGTLKALIKDSTIIYSMRTVVEWGIQLFDALSYLFNDHQIVHQDIKPENIFFTNDFSLKIGDFGLVKIIEQTCTGKFMGTERYMSPSQFDETQEMLDQSENFQDSHRNDVYSLGLVLWEIIERRLVFTEYFFDNGGFNQEKFLENIISKKLEGPEPPNCQPEIQKIISRCTNFSCRLRLTAREELLNLREILKTCASIRELKDLPKQDPSQNELVRPVDFNGKRSERFIGRGAFGEVYELVGCNPPAVIKYVNCVKESEILTFRQECDILQKISHVNVVTWIRTEEVEGSKTFAIILEYCQRGSLRDLLFDPIIIYTMRTVIWWGEQLFGALDHMFEKHNLVHRDIKPENIFVTNDFLLKIGDFGLVKVIEKTCTGTHVGTQRYMSPPQFDETQGNNEQFKKELQNSHRNDVYSLGLVMWEIVERRLVFTEYCFESEGFVREVLLWNILSKKLEGLEPPNCQPEIQAIISRCSNFRRHLRLTAREELLNLREILKTCPFIRGLRYGPMQYPSQKEPLRPVGFNGKRDWVPMEIYEKKAIWISRDRLNTKETVDIRVPSRYQPDLNDSFYHRNDTMNDDEFLIVGKSTYFSKITAILNYNYVEDPKAADEKDDQGNLMNEPVWKKVICKRYFLDSFNRGDGYTRLRREIQICRISNHSNILTHYEVFTELKANGDPSHVWLVSERMDYTLRDYYNHLEKEKREESVDIRHLAILLTQILHALDYLHQTGIMHRDIVPENIAMNKNDFTIKLQDFLLFREIDENLDHSTNVDSVPIYRAIEILLKTKYNTKVDIWSTALVAIEMLGLLLFMPTGRPEEILAKFKKRGAENALKDRIFEVIGVPEDRYQSLFGRKIAAEPHGSRFDEELFKAKRKIDMDIPPLTRENFQDLMKKMLNPDKAKRLSADECLKHPFLLKVKHQEMDHQPKTEQEIRNRNTRDRDVIIKELKAGYTRLSFQKLADVTTVEAMTERFLSFETKEAIFINESGAKNPIKIDVPFGYKPEENPLRPGDLVYRIIGEGQYAFKIAAVLDYRCLEASIEEKEREKRVICKIYSREKLDRSLDGYTKLRREIQICRIHNHPNIIQFYEVFADKDAYIWLVSERMDLTLRNFYDNLWRQPKSETEAQSETIINIRHLGALLAQILRALDYLHLRGIIHRDVVPENIALNKANFEVKLLNFGLAREIHANLDHSINVDSLPIYQAIEIILNAKYNTKVDIWSTALVAIEMLGLQLFMPEGDDQEVAAKKRWQGADKAVKNRILELIGVPGDCYESVFGRPVFGVLPNKESKVKAEISKARKKLGPDHGPLTGEAFQDLMEKMLEPDMGKRLRADECLKHPFLEVLNVHYKTNSSGDQPNNEKARNDRDKELLLNELAAGYNRLSF